MENKEQTAINLLSEIVNWWDSWNSADNPTDLEEPPINDARKLLDELETKN